jgi:hypothetical protein
MNNTQDWLEETWRIKRLMAERYAEVPPSEQILDMRARVEIEWARRGWTVKERKSGDVKQKPASPTEGR